MSVSESFLLDTNVFIEPKNRYYPFDICPGYWSLLEDNLGTVAVGSITHVYDEIVAGGDDLSKWAKNSFERNQFIDCASDQGTFVTYLKVSKYVNGLPDKRQNAKQEFLASAVADPWLVACAAERGKTVVTMETSKLASAKKVSLVDVCDYFNVRHIDLFAFLRRLSARFTLSD